MGTKEIRTGILLGLGCLLAGVGPFIASGPAVQRIAAAAAFSLPASTPFFFRNREVGITMAVVAVGLVTIASFTGAPILGVGAARKALLVRNLQLASAGAFAGGLAAGIAWARDIARTARGA
jgi:hypothetical protein